MEIDSQALTICEVAPDGDAIRSVFSIPSATLQPSDSH
jgi:hypothetical protein